VGIHKDLVTCPLCGKHAEENKEHFFEKYVEEVESVTGCARIVSLADKSKFLTRFFFTCLLLVIAISIVVNLVYFPNLVVAHYISFAAILAYVDIFWPLAKGKRLHNSIVINVILLSVFVAVIELLWHPNGWQHHYTFVYGFPAVACVGLGVINFTIVFRSTKIREYFVNLYFVVLYAVASAIVVWAIPNTFEVFATVVFFVSIVNGAIISVIFFPWIKEEFSRKFFIDGI